VSPPEFISARRVPVVQHPKERPMLYAGAMVRALLRDADPKTMTRREVTRLAGFGIVTEFDRTDTPGYDWHFRDAAMRWHDISHARLMQCCPYGQPGERLWVRETWNRTNPSGADGVYFYRADTNFPECIGGGTIWPDVLWRPSIHMPRRASRINLKITDVRVERLQDICANDAQAEGCMPLTGDDEADNWVRGFRVLWMSINGAGSWATNPWVWVVSFERIEP
jgi:hypothetical protein